jgi:4-hydroxybenzoate polyprenyltransferase
MRPRQWIKNAFVLAPLIFSGSFLDRASVARALAAVLLFCVASAATYVLNDLCDRHADRQHPIKRLTRPIAAGAVSVRGAAALLAGLALLLLAGAALFPAAGLGIGVYLLVNVAYTLRLKHVPVLDLFCIALGFVMRVAVGALAIPVVLSTWMLVTTLSLALYLATIKRRMELQRQDRGETRVVLAHYSLALLDRYAELSALSAIVFYGLFVTTVRPELAVSVPLVLFGLFRYWYIVDRRGGGESPTDALWDDRLLLGTVLSWGGLCTYVLWS